MRGPDCGSGLLPDPLVTTHSSPLPLGPELGGARRSGVVFLSPAILKIFVYVDYIFDISCEIETDFREK